MSWRGRLSRVDALVCRRCEHGASKNYAVQTRSRGKNKIFKVLFFLLEDSEIIGYFTIVARSSIG
jgi:hypothetical protein